MSDVAPACQKSRFPQEGPAESTFTSEKSFILQAHGKDLNVIMLNVIMLSVGRLVAYQMNRFLQEAQADTKFTYIKSFILQAHGKDLGLK